MSQDLAKLCKQHVEDGERKRERQTGDRRRQTRVRKPGMGVGVQDKQLQSLQAH